MTFSVFNAIKLGLNTVKYETSRTSAKKAVPFYAISDVYKTPIHVRIIKLFRHLMPLYIHSKLEYYRKQKITVTNTRPYNSKANDNFIIKQGYRYSWFILVDKNEGEDYRKSRLMHAISYRYYFHVQLAVL